jgi:type II secretory pathway predicted ATPase ExeA
MYKIFYQMKKDAFGIQPLPEVFFHSKTHKDAWYYLLYGMSSDEYFLLVTGDYGLGKTTLCLKIVKALKKKAQIPFTYISTPSYGFSKILQEVAFDLGLVVSEEDNDIQYNIYHCLENENSRKRFFLIIDDAQYLDMPILGKLQLFANFNYNGFFPIRIILFAHTSILEKLKSPELEALDQRIKRKCHLHPLSLHETKEYIYFRLLKSGAPGVPAFTEDAVRGVFDFSRGVPRLINNLCDTCLLLGAQQQVTTIDAPIVAHALEYVEGRVGKSESEEPLPSSATEQIVTMDAFDDAVKLEGSVPVEPEIDQVLASGSQSAFDDAVRLEEPAPMGPEAREALPTGPLAGFEDLVEPAAAHPAGSESDEIKPSGVHLVEEKREGQAIAWRMILLALILFAAGILLGLFIDLKPLASKYFGVLLNTSK